MKQGALTVLTILFLTACKNKHVPDVSNIKVDLQVQHFEKDFFAVDTNHLMPSLQQLSQKYPLFLTDFLANILEMPPLTDTSLQAQAVLKRFIHDYAPIKDTADIVFRDFSPIEKQVRQGLQFVQYYFPQYKAPAKLITFIGPMEGYSDVITRDALAVGLQLHISKNYSLYTSQIGQSLFPGYLSRKFTPAYIHVNCLYNVINDIVPEKLTGKPLIDQMIEKGKRLYVLDKVLPYTPDTLKIGYTNAQLKGCYEHEGLIWNYFLANNLLYVTEPELLKGLIDDAPNTPALGEASPGAIGLFTGWQIVKKYMEKHADLKLQELLTTDDRKIFEESKYKPN